MSSISRWRSGLTGAARLSSFIVRPLSVEGSRNALLAPDGAQSRRIARVTSRTSIHAPSREAGSFFGRVQSFQSVCRDDHSWYVLAVSRTAAFWAAPDV